MLRRPRGLGGAEPAADPVPTTAGDRWIELRTLRVQPATRLAELSGARLDLTKSEFDILTELLAAGQRVLTKTNLALHVRGDRHSGIDYVSEHDERAIEVHVANLRKKLGDSPATPQWIETVRGVGYRIKR